MELNVLGVPFEVKFAPDEAAAGSFEGYGAVFGNIDSHGDVIEPGAFAKSLLDRERAGRGLPPMYKMHGAVTGNRSDPIGIWEAMSEDANGLHVKGRLVGLDTEQGKWTYAQMREGALKGLSIGYRVPPAGSVGARARRVSRNVTSRPRFCGKCPLSMTLLMFWLASTAPKSADEDSQSWADQIKTIRDFEEFLREVGDFSHAAAKAIAAGGFKARPEPRDEDGEALATFISDAAKRIRGH